LLYENSLAKENQIRSREGMDSIQNIMTNEGNLRRIPFSVTTYQFLIPLYLKTEPKDRMLNILVMRFSSKYFELQSTLNVLIAKKSILI
jgi:hypothetical protein